MLIWKDDCVLSFSLKDCNYILRQHCLDVHRSFSPPHREALTENALDAGDLEWYDGWDLVWEDD